MLQKILVAAMGVLSATLLYAQTASLHVDTSGTITAAEQEKQEPSLIISGSLDAYYKYDFAKTPLNSLTSFTQSHNSFSLGMASIKLEHRGSKITAVADLGFGPRAKDFSYTDEGITRAIKQLFISYSPLEWLKFTAGTWATHVGYELIDPQLNRNYSMSYMFTNGPFSHTGLKAEVTSGKHSAMIGVANATDYRIPPGGFINKKFILAQYALAATENLKLYLNFVSGQNPDTSKVSQLDAVITAKVNDKFSLGYNGTASSVKTWDGVKSLDNNYWWGSALYINLDPTPWFGITLRGEYFSDKKQLKPFATATEGGNIFATTLSANFKSGGFIFIPELRLDQAGKEVLFIDKSGAYTKSAVSLLFAAIYSF
jgi:hypothetical protein